MPTVVEDGEEGDGRREVSTVRLSLALRSPPSSPSSWSESRPPYSDWLSRARLEPGVGPSPREEDERREEEAEAGGRRRRGSRAGASAAELVCCTASCQTMIWLS